MRPEDQPLDARRDRERHGRRLTAAAGGLFDHPARVDPRGVNIGMPAAVRVPGDGAAEIIVARDHALDVDALDLFAVIGNTDREPPIKPRGSDFNVGDLGNAVVVEIDDQFRDPRRPRQFPPVGLIDREAGRAQIEIGDGLSARPLEA